jgi:hypothetical protein
MEKIYELLEAEMLLTENLASYLHLYGEFEASNHLTAGVVRLKRILEEFDKCIEAEECHE